MYAAAVVVNAYKNGKNNPPYYYINGFRLFAKPVLNNLPTTLAHQASWYLRFEQVDGYTSVNYDHPYYNEDNAGGLSVDKPHMVYIEEKPVSRVATEIGVYPFWSYTGTDPSKEGYVPAVSYISLVKYVCCQRGALAYQVGRAQRVSIPMKKAAQDHSKGDTLASVRDRRDKEATWFKGGCLGLWALTLMIWEREASGRSPRMSITASGVFSP